MNLDDANVLVSRTGPLMYDFKTMTSRCRLEWLLGKKWLKIKEISLGLKLLPKQYLFYDAD